MNTYWVDFNGWFQIEADTPEKANEKAIEEISVRMGNFEDGLTDFHFEIDGVEITD